MHSQQLRPQDHRHFLARVVASETQLEEVACASLPWAEHAGSAPDGRQVEILGLAEAHPDLVSQSVVYHCVALLAERHRKLQWVVTLKEVELLGVWRHPILLRASVRRKGLGWYCYITQWPALLWVAYKYDESLLVWVSRYHLTRCSSEINVNSATFLFLFHKEF